MDYWIWVGVLYWIIAGWAGYSLAVDDTKPQTPRDKVMAIFVCTVFGGIAVPVRGLRKLFR